MSGGRLRILGLDPGTLRLGYGAIDHHGSIGYDYVDCGVLTAAASEPRDARLLTIGRDLRELLRELDPDVVAMEQAFYSKSVQATLALGSHYLERGQYKPALERFLAAAELAPGYEMPFAYAARAMQKLGATKEATEFERLAQGMAGNVLPPGPATGG